MSKKSTIAAVAAGAGVLALGWNLGTAGGQTVGLPVSQTTQPAATTKAATTPPANTEAQTEDDETTSSPTAAPSTTQAAAPTTEASTAATQAAGGLKDGTYTGDSVSYRYGSLNVSVTIAGGKITSVSESITSDGDRKSENINSRAVPTLRSEIVAANSAEVSTIGGATYTSDAYLQSLQSALDQATA